MDFLVLDTCIVLHILRKNDYGSKCITAIEGYSPNPSFIISAVTKGELESLKVQRQWGEPRCKSMNEFLENVTYVDVHNQDVDLMNAYANLDAYSNRKGTDDNGNLLPGSAKPMAKNDLWIAATAHALDIPLMTSDSDFDHLNDKLIKVIKIE